MAAPTIQGYQYLDYPPSYGFEPFTAILIGSIGAAYLLIAGLRLREARALRARQPDAPVPDTGARFFATPGCGLVVYPVLYALAHDGSTHAYDNVMLFKLLLYFCMPVPWVMMSSKKFAHCKAETRKDLWLVPAVLVLVLALFWLFSEVLHLF